ncbi:MAG: chemotaxis protein CheA [Thermodesulfobacteriota bacterium]|nr:chemotaxis protein CheA [Thermodesulfobacteriota bacterium]
MASASSDEDREILLGFVSESREMFEEIELNLLQLQEIVEASGEPDDEVINNIFRMFHSAKGSAGFLQLYNIAKVTHEAETLLDFVRQGKYQLERSHADLLIHACDVVQRILDAIEASSSDEEFDTEALSLIGKFAAAHSAHSSLPPETQPDASQPDFPYEFQLTITPEMVKQFVHESDEILDTVEHTLLELEKTPNNTDHMDTAFRNIHSFKGNCGFMGYADLERLSHKVETVLGAMRSGQIPVKAHNIKSLLRILDMICDGVVDISNEKAGDIDGCDLLVQLMDEMLPECEDTPEPQKIGEILVARNDATPEAVEEALEVQNKPMGEILVDMGAAHPKAVESALEKQAKQEKRAAVLESGGKKVTRRDIRVDLDKLDSLINLVGELVIAKAMVTNNPDLQDYEFENFEKASHHLERVASELQDVAMSVRMIPVSGVFRKMIRLVHDLSAKCGKKVHLTRIGEETEVDKTVIEQISDPLVHIIRNSLDHGIEPPEERKSCGKSETGEITLKAEHEGGEVLITVRDNGCGLDREKILALAVKRGVISGDGSDMRDEDIFKCIFEPGFSTAETITNVSGRGVGMDVVKKNIENLKGRVDIRSSKGKGTTIILRIPLTLAVMEGMLVRVGGQRYTVPLLAIKESFRPTPRDITVPPDGQEVVRIHGELLPVVRLHRLYKVHADHTQLHHGIMVAVDYQTKGVCLFVDEVLGQQQTVIKRLSDYYVEDARGVSGCTILGDGEVSLILDIKGLIEMAGN